MNYSRIGCLLVLVFFSEVLFAQNILERYQRAEQLLPKNITKLTKNVSIRINPIDDTDDFWYKLQTEKGEKYYLFDGEELKPNEAFDHTRLAESINAEVKTNFNADSIKLSNLKFDSKENKIKFTVDTAIFEVSLEDYSIEKKESKKSLKKNQSESPDGKWIAEVRNYNLFIKDLKSGEEFQLSDDGIEKYEYATPLSWYKLVDESEGEEYDPSIYVNWSDDSKKLICARLDRRKVGKLYMYQSAPDSGFRAKVWSYERALPGEETITAEYYVFDVEQKTKVKVDLPAFADFTSSIWPTWFKNNKEFYFARFQRGYKAIDLFKVNADNGETETLLSHESETMVEYQTINCEWTDDGKQFFWTSERDGWNHIYRYNNKGNLINQLTKGEYVIHEIVKIDEENQLVYFIAGGKELGVDPYSKILYKVDFKGNNVEILTKENANHRIWIPDSGNYFVDSYSTCNQATKHVVRNLEDGRIIHELASANVDLLLATGWKYPEPFKVKARDGITDIYGLMFYPTDFDKTKSYPIIDASYSGPQAVRTPKTFDIAYNNYDRSIAELGFIVITIDGLGMAWRSKAFHDVSYKNLGDIGAEDHIAGIKQLAQTRPWMDLERVGIYGRSAGGYDAAHALLTHPEFYKVGVATAGNHDHRIAKAWWPEQYMGMPGKHYDEQSNFELAKNLEGKLLLVHGDMDNNVNPASSMHLAAELIKHNKDFELLIMPGEGHSFKEHPYYIRKRWDWFVEHLLGVEPPKEYIVKSYKN